MHITFICSGNTCRSPIAEGVARKLLEDNYPGSGVTVSSAGLATYNGLPASQHSIDVCGEMGIDINAHRSRRFNPEIAENTDIFAVMTDEHRQILLRYGIPESRIAVLGGVPDPYGGDRDEYRRCRNQIIAETERLLNRVLSDRPKTAGEEDEKTGE